MSKNFNQKIRIGYRWDDNSQNPRVIEGKNKNLIDYIEVNYPVSPLDDLKKLNIPILAHTSHNALCSAAGLNYSISGQVKENADLFNSPWIGEHLSFVGYEKEGALGYVINPIFSYEFMEVTVANISCLKKLYQRPIAVELAPLYYYKGDFKNELDFTSEVARRSDSYIIFDLAHWLISNKNIRREKYYGLDDIEFDRVIELHVAGMRKSGRTNYWYDGHEIPPSSEIYDILPFLLEKMPNIKAITIEHSMKGDEKELFRCAEILKGIVNGR